jgi:hypothetical protein
VKQLDPLIKPLATVIGSRNLVVVDMVKGEFYHVECGCSGKTKLRRYWEIRGI